MTYISPEDYDTLAFLNNDNQNLARELDRLAAIAKTDDEQVKKSRFQLSASKIVLAAGLIQGSAVYGILAIAQILSQYMPETGIGAVSKDVLTTIAQNPQVTAVALLGQGVLTTATTLASLAFMKAAKKTIDKLHSPESVAQRKAVAASLQNAKGELADNGLALNQLSIRMGLPPRA